MNQMPSDNSIRSCCHRGLEAVQKRVDCFNQVRSTHAICRNETRVPMSIFTFLLGAIFQNVYEITQALGNTSDPQPPVRELKKFIAKSFLPLMERNVRRRTIIPVTSTPQTRILESYSDAKSSKKERSVLPLQADKSEWEGQQVHVLLHRLPIFLPVNCFAFFHNLQKRKRIRPNVAAIFENSLQSKGTRGLLHRKNKRSANLGTPVYPENMHITSLLYSMYEQREKAILHVYLLSCNEEPSSWYWPRETRAFVSVYFVLFFACEVAIFIAFAFIFERFLHLCKHLLTNLGP